MSLKEEDKNKNQPGWIKRDLNWIDRLKIASGHASLPIAKRLEAGFNIEQVDDDTYKARLALCTSCENLFNGSCRLCGCPMAYKAKLMYNPYMAAINEPKTKVKCPVGHW